jgi:hypothetical protein
MLRFVTGLAAGLFASLIVANAQAQCGGSLVAGYAPTVSASCSGGLTAGGSTTVYVQRVGLLARIRAARAARSASRAASYTVPASQAAGVSYGPVQYAPASNAAPYCPMCVGAVSPKPAATLVSKRSGCNCLDCDCLNCDCSSDRSGLPADVPRGKFTAAAIKSEPSVVGEWL